MEPTYINSVIVYSTQLFPTMRMDAKDSGKGKGENAIFFLLKIKFCIKILRTVPAKTKSLFL